MPAIATTYTSGIHDHALAVDAAAYSLAGHYEARFAHTFSNFFHPFVGELIAKLNRESLPGLLDATWQDELEQVFFSATYAPVGDGVTSFPKAIDVSANGPYATYNWELFFHIPFTIAVHLSKTQRFAEAQRWFHFLFDPTASDDSPDPQIRFWRFLAFRQPDDMASIAEIVGILSEPRSELSAIDQARQDAIMDGYNAIRNKPFQPHAVARTRHLAYRYAVVMKYLDNLIAWGDHLFQQDTVESINEATQIYVLASNVLGERPQRIPPRGRTGAKTFAQLRAQGLGPVGNALVELEGDFPFNLAAPGTGTGPATGADGEDSLFGIGRTLAFCVPPNDRLLGYWDTVADRLFKIRNCMNIVGVVRQLALFDPPIDPGLLVKAAAAGLDIGSVVGGLNQPIGPVRSLPLIQKALELASEIRGLGTALLAALERGDAEELSLIRGKHELQIVGMSREVRFLQWQATREATTSLLSGRASTLERLRYYARLLGLPADQNAPDAITLDRRDLTEETFDEAYAALVGQYERPVTLQNLPALRLAGDSSPGILSGYSGSGKVYLSHNEDVELNTHLPLARDATLLSTTFHSLAATLSPIPDPKVDLHYWGLGGTIDLKVGTVLATVARLTGDIAGITAAWERDQAGMAARYAGYERRADEWLLQYNLAARELTQVGRQILTGLIAEQIARHEVEIGVRQIEHAGELDRFLHEKFTNKDLHLWMQGELSRLYYEYYRFAVDAARKAEKTMKLELMRPELDAQDFVGFNHWDGGRKGLLAGEALVLDIRRLELAYHEHNRRELEMTKHVSLRQLDPVALLRLRTTGSCQVTIPEWLYDLDCPGHYMRRIKQVAVSLPSVVGPYTGVNCTVSLLKSTVRRSPTAGTDYARQGAEDDRFLDYAGAVQSVVITGAQNDFGMFEANLRDERFLPFEGAGAESTWKLDLPWKLDRPKNYPAFDYRTISDVILHVRYTARQGVEPTKVRSALTDLLTDADQTNLALLFSLRHDFPTEWAAFVAGDDDFSTTIREDHFPYFTRNSEITIEGIELYDSDTTKHHAVGDQAAWDAASADLAVVTHRSFSLSVGEDAPGPMQVLSRNATEAFLIVRYSLS